MKRVITSEYFINGHFMLLVVIAVYVFIAAFSLQQCYFWDNVQFTSKEAHWYYENNFSSLLLPGFSEDTQVVGTGCHPPLIGLITAMFWKVSGRHLWISHLFIAIWAMVLIYNTSKLLKSVLPPETCGWLLPLLLLDSAVLTQIFIASPDIILLASFVMALRAITENRKYFLGFSLFFLVLINGRGTITGMVLFIFYLIHQVAAGNKKFSFRLFAESTVPFLPAFLIAGFYYVSYIINFGWFFNNPDSPWAGSGAKPEGILHLAKNMAAYLLRLGENGRFFIYFTAVFVLVRLRFMKSLKKALNGFDLSLIIVFLLLFLFFLYFVLTTTAVITSRYYMGMFFILTLLLFRALPSVLSIRKIRIISIAGIIMLLSGNLWVYPDRISKAWDATLAHLPYYELRDECFDYLINNNYDLSKVSGGFCFSGNQKYIDLKDRGWIISDKPDNQYYIYSNISNPDDTILDALSVSGKWQEIKTFRKCFVHVSLYENNSFNSTDQVYR